MAKEYNHKLTAIIFILISLIGMLFNIISYKKTNTNIYIPSLMVNIGCLSYWVIELICCVIDERLEDESK